jgi:hypothetical protein
MGYFSSNQFSGNYWADDLFHGAGSTPTPIPGPSPFGPFEDIMTARPRSGNSYGLSHDFITMFGGRPTPIMFYEPDAISFHSNYYYNSRTNQLFRRVATPDNRAVWKSVGEN